MKVRTYLQSRLQGLSEATDQFIRGEFRLNSGVLCNSLFGVGKKFPVERGWVATWGALGELLLPLVRASRGYSELKPEQLEELYSEFVEFAGGDRICRDWLDEFVTTGEASESGRKVLESIIKSMTRAISAARTHPEVIGQSLGRELLPEEVTSAARLFDDLESGVLAPIASVMHLEVPENPSIELSADDLKRTWLGLGARIPLEPMAAIIYLALQVASDVFPLAPQTITQPGEDFFAALADERNGLPPLLAKKFTAGERLMKHKAFVENEADYYNSGIESPGTTELDRRGFQYLFGEGRHQPAVVLAPTSGGKSRFGQLALIQTVHQIKRIRSNAFGRAVVLAPTKALVDQVTREIRETLADTEGSDWTVLASSRDYPQNDEALRKSRFDIAVVIPEKLAALVRSGMSTERLSILLVDELQHIVDGDRGRKLESLLIDVFNKERVPRFIGLSASLAPATVELLTNWFKRNGVSPDILEMKSRPVPLTVSVVDDNRRLTSRTHILEDRTTRTKGLPSIPPPLGSRRLLNAARNYRRPLSLLMEILEPFVEDSEFTQETPSILVFVRSRQIAEDLAQVTRELVVRHLGVSPTAPIGSSSLAKDSRFQPFGADSVSGEREQIHQVLPPTPLRLQMEETSLSGVGFHSASLTATTRVMVEDLFRKGQVRVLFATDTLRLGINLPADIVINGDLLMYTGEPHPHLLNKDVLLQRLGRAGRLMHSRGLGSGYLVTPEFVEASVENQLDESTALLYTGRAHAQWHEVRDAATNSDSLFRAFAADWSGGADYSPPYDDDWFEEILLQHLADTPTGSLPVPAANNAAEEVFKRTISYAAGEKIPTRAIDKLIEIGAVTELGDNLVLTDAGRATAMNALGLVNLPIIEDIAEEATNGAGPLTLLFIACESPFVGRAQQDLRLFPTTRKEVLEGVLAQISRIKNESASKDQLRRSKLMRNFPADISDFIGAGPTAERILELLDIEQAREATDSELTALLRAFNIYMRWAGFSYKAISGLPSTTGNPVTEVGLERLSGNTAYFLAAAADLLSGNPGSMHFRTLSYFASEVELGIPAILAPILRLNRPSVSRERILGIARLLERDDLRWDGLSDLFQAYVNESQAIPRANEGWYALSATEIQEITEELTAIDMRQAGAAYSVSPEAELMLVPGLEGMRVGDVLRSIPQGNAAWTISAMLKAFGNVVDYVPNTENVSISYKDHEGKEHTTTFHFPTEKVDNSLLDTIVAGLTDTENAMVVAVEGATFGAVNRGRFLTEPCSIIDPSLLVELIARLYSRNSTSPVLGNEDDLLDELFGTPAMPDVDTSTAQSDLARVLLYNAPMLSRSDLENRLAFKSIE